MKVTFWLYKILKPLYTRLEKRAQAEIQRAAKLKNLEFGLKLRQFYRERLTPEAWKALRRQPPTGGCSHLKGVGPYRGPNSELGKFRSFITDYNVSMHTFVDGKARIRCNRCGETRWQGESGFAEFLKMVAQSTNTPSSSEYIVRR